MFEIKKIPEDFRVKEISNLEIKDKGNFTYFLVKKTNWSTLNLIGKISERLRLRRKFIGIAGSKDKNAITEQYFSFSKTRKERVLGLKIRDVEFSFVGYGDKRINLGDLEENDFIITIRNLDKKIEKKVDRIKNFFDEQRFGINKLNHLIGGCLVKKDFKKACELLNLEFVGNDFIGALRNIDRRLLRFYVHSYSSDLFNRALGLLDKDYGKIPILGFSTEFKNEDVKKVYEKILEEEGIKLEDFNIKSMPELNNEGGEREMFADVKDFKILDFDKDELNEGKFKEIIGFRLGKGDYGTLVVKEFVS